MVGQGENHETLCMLLTKLLVMMLLMLFLCVGGGDAW